MNQISIHKKTFFYLVDIIERAEFFLIFKKFILQQRVLKFSLKFFRFLYFLAFVVVFEILILDQTDADFKF